MRLRLGTMFRLGETRSGAPILVHWSVPAICLVYLGAGSGHLLTTAAAVASYVAMLIVHEVGHHVVARRRGYDVLKIEIFPFHGTCHHEAPASRLDGALIAWGGPLAQLILAVPLMAFVILGGYLRFEPLNAILAILGFFSAAIAVFNLLPIRPLDGSKAWSAVPILFSRLMRRRSREPQTAMEAMQDALRKARRRNAG